MTATAANGRPLGSVWGAPGRTVEANVAVYRCVGLARTPGLDHCPGDLAAITSTQVVSVVIPASGVADFSVRAGVDCCEIDEADLLSVNGQTWGTSYFVRWAESPLCPYPRTPTPTPTASRTVTASPTNTSTPTPTSTPLLRKEQWHEVLSAGYSQRYNITLQNTTGALMRGVVVTDTLPAGALFSDATIVLTGTLPPETYAWYPEGGEWDGAGSVMWSAGDLPPDYYASMKLHVHLLSTLPPGSVLTNVVTYVSASGSIMTTTATTLISAEPAAPTPVRTPTFTPTPLCPSRAIAQVDAGSASPYVDSAGVVWSADRSYIPGSTSWGYIGESATYTTTDVIWGTGEPALYQTERWWQSADGGYRFELPNGDYEVVIKLAEIYAPAKIGSRVFSVQVQGATVMAHLDVLDLAGLDMAYDVVAPAQVRHGILAVDLIAESGNPAVKAIGVRTVAACTPTATPSPTASQTATPTTTATPTLTATARATPTETGTPTPTESATATPSATASPTASETATLTASATPSATPSQTATATPTPSETATLLPTPVRHLLYLPVVLVDGT